MDDIINKSLVVGDKFMPSMYLTILRGRNYKNKLIQEFVKAEPLKP